MSLSISLINMISSVNLYLSSLSILISLLFLPKINISKFSGILFKFNLIYDSISLYVVGLIILISSLVLFDLSNKNKSISDIFK